MRLGNSLTRLPLLAAAACALQAQAKIGEARFVQAFYDWYVPIAHGNNPGPAWNVVLTDRAAALDSELVRALATDSAAQAKAPGYIVGLDFDPFLGTQDPYDRYEVGKTARHGERSFVDVYSVHAGKRSEKPDVIPELTWQHGSWVFVNFHYPRLRTDLLSVLKKLRQQRQ